MDIKLIASKSKVTIGDFLRRRSMRVFSSGHNYTSVTGDSYERGHIANGVVYPDGKQPYRMLDLIVAGETEPIKMEITFESVIDYKQKVLDVQSTAKCYHMQYMGEFHFVVYDSDHKRHYRKSEYAAWEAAYKHMKK